MYLGALGDQPITNDIASQCSQSTATCGCPEQIVSQKDFMVTFRELKLDEEYFPMIARTESRAFFGLPPNQIRPNARETKRSEPQTPKTPISPIPSQPNSSTERNININLLKRFHLVGDYKSTRENVSPSSSHNDILSNRDKISTSSIDQEPPGQDSDSESIGENPLQRSSKGSSSVLHESEKRLWTDWEKTELQRAFLALAPAFKPPVKVSCMNFPNLARVGLSHERQDASYLESTEIFKKDEYFRVTTGLTEPKEFIILVRNIVRRRNDDGTEAIELLILKHSFLSDISPCAPTSKDSTSASKQELVLHFRDFNSMGRQEDAEVIYVKEILHAKHLTEDLEAYFDIVEYRVSFPSGKFYEVTKDVSWP